MVQKSMSQPLFILGISLVVFLLKKRKKGRPDGPLLGRLAEQPSQRGSYLRTG
jgi:hypothetical protein